jgi:hypothetical protein
MSQVETIPRMGLPCIWLNGARGPLQVPFTLCSSGRLDTAQHLTRRSSGRQMARGRAGAGWRGSGQRGKGGEDGRERSLIREGSPPGVHQVSYQDLQRLGVGQDGQLYWDGRWSRAAGSI